MISPQAVVAAGDAVDASVTQARKLQQACLATTGSCDIWDPALPIIVVAGWCLRYDQRAHWQSRAILRLPDPWSDAMAVGQAVAYCDGIIEELLLSLSEQLNRSHGLTCSVRYWRVLLWPWLMSYVHIFYDRYVRLHQAIDQAETMSTAWMPPEQARTPADTWDFLRLASEDDADLFNLQICSHVLAAMRRQGEAPGLVLEPLRTTPSWTHSAPATASRARRASSSDVAAAWLGMNRIDRWRLAWRCRVPGLASDVPQPAILDAPVDPARRRDLHAVPMRDAFGRLLAEGLSVYLPTLFLERFDAWRRVSLSAWRKPPRLLVGGTSWYVHEPFKLLAAEAVERGGRLIAVQHGGGTGVDEDVPQEDLELRAVDRWLSWGWTSDRAPEKVAPCPSPRFPWRSRAHRPWGTGRLLLLTDSYVRYPFKFETDWTGRAETVAAWRHRFIQALAPLLKPQLMVRFHGTDGGAGYRQQLFDACGPLAMDPGQRPLRRLLLRTRVAIVEYLGTTYLELFAANVPTLMFVDPRFADFRPAARPLVKALRAAGILWHDPEQAAEKLATIAQDPTRWWRDATVQQARRAFLQQYSRYQRNWPSAWARLVAHELAASRAQDHW